MSLRLEDLCNGSTPDSDSVCGGSNPSSSAKKEARCFRSGFSFLAEDEQDSKGRHKRARWCKKCPVDTF